VTDCFRPANRPWPTCRFAPDGRMLAACCSEHGRDSCVRTWDVPTWRERAVLAEATGPLDFSPDGKYLATVTAGEMWKRIRLWDTATFQACQAFSLDHGAARLAMSPGGRFLAIAAWRGRSFPETVCWWEVTTGKPIGEVQTGLGFAFAADDQALAVELPAGADERVRIYDPESGAVTKRVSLRDDRKVPLSTMETDHNILYMTLDQSDSWSEALQSDYWGEVVRWLHKKGITFITLGTYPTQMLDAVSGRPVGTLPVSALGGRWSPDGKTLAVMRAEDELQLWDIPARKPLWLFLALAALLALPVAGMAWWRVRNASAKRR
jgi:WD40 repeat protein